MRKRYGVAVAIVVAALATAASAYGLSIVLHAGDLIVHAHGDFAPKKLPKHVNAPISAEGGGSLSTVSGELPPILKTITLLYDKHGSVVTTGLPVCTPGQLQATDVKAARRACPDAIVGKGKGTATVAFPEQKPFKVSSPITLFNGPKQHGDPTVIAHAYTTVPVATTFIVPIVIEKIHKGVYGYRTEAKIPRIAGGNGIPISGEIKVDRKWTYKGKKYSYINARCETGKLQAKGQFTFDDGTFMQGSFVFPCKAR